VWRCNRFSGYDRYVRVFRDDWTFQAVTATGKGLDMRGGSFLCSEDSPDHCDILSEVGLIHHAVRPNRGDDFFFSEDLAGVLDQDQEGLDGFSRHVDRFVVTKQDLGCGVEFPRSEREDDSLLQTARSFR
jgi:hypothetical protein